LPHESFIGTAWEPKPFNGWDEPALCTLFS